MVYYLDASAWVKRHVEEDGSEWVRLFWRKRPLLACSVLGNIEVLSAIMRRAGRVDARAEAVRASIHADGAGFFEVSISQEVLSRTEDFVVRHRLRCADAIHLASAIYLREELGEPIGMVSSDAELLAAAQSEGLATLDPNSSPPIPSGASTGTGPRE